MTGGVVVDANLTLALILPLPYSRFAAQQFEDWKRKRVTLYAPSLWSYEIVSGLRKATFDRVISLEAVREALPILWRLHVTQVSQTPSLAAATLHWAERLGRRVAYDASYVALAEDLGVELWTADGSLVRNLQQIGVTWVIGVGAEDVGGRASA